MKERKMIKGIFSVLLVLALVLTTFPLAVFATETTVVEFAGGSGTEEDPYLIETPAQLDNVRNNLSAHYRLNNDIVFAESDFAEGGSFYNNGQGWIAMGEEYASPFTGVFDGNGYAIIGIMSQTVSNYAAYSGLFGINNGVIKNLGVANGNVSLKASGNAYLGGIVGLNQGEISNCYNTTMVFSSYTGGGIVGMNRGTINNCYNSATIAPLDPNSYSAGIGGIVGINLATVNSCYNVGIIGGSTSGGIAGDNRGTMINSYYSDMASKSCGTGTDAGKRCTFDELEIQTTFTGFDFDNVWKMNDDAEYPYPVLRIVSHIKSVAYENTTEFLGGTGTKFSPYLIANVEHLKNMQKYPWAYYKFVNDIVFDEEANASWVALGNKGNFTGCLDGDGYAIKGLQKVLFDCNQGTIKKIVFLNATVSDNAVIALTNKGAISECMASVDVNISSKTKLQLGGLVQVNKGTVSNCFFTGGIVANTTSSQTCVIGGIVGENTGTVSECYISGVISSNKTVGGIVGENKNGTVKNCYHYDDLTLGGSVDTSYGIAGSVEDLKTQGFYQGFDFVSVWSIDPQGDFPAPCLRNLKHTPSSESQGADLFAGGNGSYFYPFLISNAEHFKNISKYANSKKLFKLTADIVLDKVEADCLISEFSGELDGNSHTISNLTLVASTVEDANIGIFGVNNGIIKNLKLKDCAVESPTTDILEHTNIGVLTGTNNGTISNVEIDYSTEFRLPVSTKYVNIGGLIGYNASTVKNVSSTGEFKITSDKNLFNTYIGALIGKSGGNVSNITNNANFILDFAGKDSDRPNAEIGGIVGNCNNATIEKAYNKGEIKVNSTSENSANRLSIGGIVGAANASSVSLSGNYGKIKVDSHCPNSSDQVEVGGIIGSADSSASVKKSFNTGELTLIDNSNMTIIAGIVAYLRGSIEDCYNTGKIEAIYKAGGIAGEAAYYSSIKRCYNIGEIIAKKAGGIAGYNGDAISNTYYTGSVAVYEGSTTGTQFCSASKLKIASNLKGFDFTSVWTMAGNADYPYPELKDNLMKIIPDTTCTHKYNKCDVNCTICGDARVVVHVYDTDCDEICNSCGQKRTPIIAHKYDDNCDTSCNECGAIRTVTHDYKWVIDEQNNCGVNGIKHQECSVCGIKQNENTVILATGDHTYDNACDTVCNVCEQERVIKHDYKWVIDQAENCGVNGIKHEECTVCGEKRNDNTVIEATGNHTYDNNCDTSCNVCKATRTISHTYKTTTTKATTSKNGSIIKKCTVCGDIASKTTIAYAKTFKLSTTEYTYNGKTKKPSVKIYDSKGNKLTYGEDYTYTRPSSSKYVGQYKIKVTLKGKYSGTKTLYYEINPKETSVSKLTAGKKSLKVEIKKQSSQTTGYEIQYSTSKKFSSKYTKTKKVTSYKTTSVTLKSLKAKKTYYVRVRTYKIVDGKKYYSDWSSYKYKKTK